MDKIKRNFCFGICVCVLLVLCSCSTKQTEIGQEIEITSQMNDKLEGNIVINERQKGILQESNLPTDYEALSERQKNAITAIEELLVYIEAKYNTPFVYDGYVAPSTLDKEHLKAHPEGHSPLDEVIVYRELIDGEYVFSDNYSAVLAKPLYEKAVCNYLNEVFPEGECEVFAEVTDASDQELSEENVLANATAKVYILLNESDMQDKDLKKMAECYGEWMKKASQSAQASSTMFIVANADQLETINEATYAEKILSEDFSDHIICSISGSGAINII